LPTVSGYTCIGVVGAESSAWELPLSKSTCTASRYYWAVSNPKSQATTFTIKANLLYIRNVS
jgi:hypothetical protein